MAWIYYDGSVPLSNFLAKAQPSQLTQDTAPWIYVNDMTRPHEESSFKDENVPAMLAEWKAVNQAHRASPDELCDHILKIAHRYNCLSGKWMVFCKTEEVDQVWERIARAVVEGRLAPCNAAKVNPRDVSGSGNNHGIMVYTKDFSNKADVDCARSKLRSECGIVEKISYKPDIYTHLGVYSHNEWGLRPSLYRS